MAQELDSDASLTVEDLAQVRLAWAWVSTQMDETLVRTYIEHMRPQLDRRGLHRESLDWAKRDLRATRVLGDDTDEMFSLTYLGRAYEQVGLPQDAIESFLEALPLAEHGVNYRAKGVILGHLGSVYKSIGDYERAREYFSQALAHGQELQHGASETVWASILGHTQTRVGDTSKAVELYKEALARARALDDYQREASAWRDLADAYALTGDLPQAQHAFEQARSVSATHQDLVSEVEALAGLATIAVRAGDEQAERKYHNEMLAILPRIASVRNQVQFLGGAGLRYGDVQAWRPALEMHESQLSLARQIADPGEEGLALAFKGQALHALGQLAEAEQAWEESVVLLQKVGDRHYEGRALLSLARLYEEWNRPDDARRYYDSVRAMAQTLGDQWLLREMDSQGGPHAAIFVPQPMASATRSEATNKDLNLIPKPVPEHLPPGKVKAAGSFKLNTHSLGPNQPKL